MFDGARRVGPGIVWVNTAWLFTIVVLPFPTEMVGPPDDAFTLRFYVFMLFVSGVPLLTVMTVLVGRTGPPRSTRRRGTPRPGPRPACCSWSSW